MTGGKGRTTMSEPLLGWHKMDEEDHSAGIQVVVDTYLRWKCDRCGITIVKMIERQSSPYHQSPTMVKFQLMLSDSIRQHLLDLHDSTLKLMTEELDD